VCVLFPSVRHRRPKIVRRHINYDPAGLCRRLTASAFSPGKRDRLRAELQAWRTRLVKELKALRRTIAAMKQTENG
jgi:hypothetical protein